MRKSVYSLVLMDDIVASIDELAYSLNTSRSNLINQILAEKVALITPEQHLQTIFNKLSEYLRPYQHFQIQNHAADHMYSIKSALKYKYNPTIRYAIYLGKQGSNLTGELRVISRTQSELLCHNLNYFFNIWSAIEDEKRHMRWQREDGVKWRRKLNLEQFQNPTQYSDLAQALSDYVSVLDQGLKLYFTQMDAEQTAFQNLITHYENYETQNRKKI